MGVQSNVTGRARRRRAADSPAAGRAVAKGVRHVVASVSARRDRVFAAVVVAALLVSACSAGASPEAPAPSQTPASPSPSPPAIPSPSPTPPAVAVDDTLVARIFMYPDVTAGRVPPMLSVYADGRVLSPSWNADGGFALPFVQRRLTPAGLAELRSTLEGSGFFAGDIEIPPTTEVSSGFTTYVVSLRLGDRLVTARTTNFAMSTKGRALVDLAERWVRPERELPADAWLPGDAAYEAARWYVALSLNPAGVSSADVDSTALESVIGNLASFGRLVRSSEAGTDRCASVDADVVARIVAAYAAQGIELGPGDGEYFADLPWSGGRGSVLLGASAMFPDDSPACPPGVGP
jgi:hypothetical protein